MSVPPAAIGAMLGEFGHYYGWWPGKANGNGQVEDVSGQGNHLSRRSGLSLAALTANAGYFSTIDEAGGLGHVVAGKPLPFDLSANNTLIVSLVTKNTAADGALLVGNGDGNTNGLLGGIIDNTTAFMSFGADGGDQASNYDILGNAKSGLDAHLGFVLDRRRARVNGYFNGVGMGWQADGIVGAIIARGTRAEVLAIGHEGSPSASAVPSVAAQFKWVHVAVVNGAVNEARMDALMARLAASGTAYIRAQDIQP